MPKFILRNFLVKEGREQVAVYDKATDKSFVTSIRNIMAENRFNDFAFDEYLVSFEPVATHIENIILPTYRTIIETRQLDGTAEQRVDLAFFVAFQFLRSKANREMMKDLDDYLERIVTESGGKMENVRGWEPQTDDTRKRFALQFMQKNIGEFANILAYKEFRLAQPSPGRTFYLGDNPVCRHNSIDARPYGNLGFACKGIEVYLPLAHDLLLCIWCPTIVQDLRDRIRRTREEAERHLMLSMIRGHISGEQMRSSLSEMTGKIALDELEEALITGRTMTSNEENMDFYNSLQVSEALRYVVCKQSDFRLARRFNAEFPNLRRGRKFSS